MGSQVLRPRFGSGRARIRSERDPWLLQRVLHVALIHGEVDDGGRRGRFAEQFHQRFIRRDVHLRRDLLDELLLVLRKGGIGDSRHVDAPLTAPDDLVAQRLRDFFPLHWIL